MDKQTALKLCKVKPTTYNTWLKNEEFVSLHQRRDEFSGEYKLEAIQLLRRDNQLAAVLLEGKIVAKMQRELDTGKLSLVKTNLAREVYSKLMSDLDYQPQVQKLTWQQRIENFRIIGGNNAIIETTGVEETESPQSITITEGEQASDEVKQETKED